MSFLDDVVKQVIPVAKRNGIEPAALMAVVEVESAGQPFESDGKTPRFLYERHVMYKELLKKRGKAKAEEAVSLNLARNGWNRSVQYKDQRSSAGRLALLKRAEAFDKECAYRSCSWGVGQTMGFHAESQGFKDAIAMVNTMTAGGVPAQIEAMIKEIKKSKLIAKMNAHDWAGFAYRYNGAGYAQNAYDKKMAQAYARWKKKLQTVGTIPEPVPVPEVEDDYDPQIDLPQNREDAGEKKDLSAVLRQIGTVLATIGGFFTNQYVLGGLVLCIAVYAIWAQSGKPEFWKPSYWKQ